jgi:uncharacterized membrane protein
VPDPDDESQRLRYARGTEEFGRFTAFTDGVVAIAMTLLVLNLELPEPGPGVDPKTVDLFSVIADMNEQFTAFVLSFVIVGFYWVQQHRFVAQLKAVDFPMLAWTLAFLLVIVLVPFESEIIGEYSGNEQAVVLYASWFVVFGIIDVAGYLLALKRGLLTELHTPARIRFSILVRLNAPAIFLLSMPLAYLVSPDVAMLSWFLVWPVAVLTGRRFPTDSGDETADATL